MYSFQLHCDFESHRHYRLMGKRYRIDSASETLYLLVEIVHMFSGDCVFRPVFICDRIRRVKAINCRSVLTYVAEKTADSRVRTIAILLRGHCGGALGTSSLWRFAKDADETTRKTLTRALKRMHAWSQLEQLAKSDPCSQVRRIASVSSPKRYQSRLSKFCKNVDRKIVGKSKLDLIVSPTVDLQLGKQPKSDSLIRKLLEQIHRAVVSSRGAIWMLAMIVSMPIAYAQHERIVRSSEELKNAVASIQPNSKIRIAPGNYSGGWEFRNIDNLTLEALDPANPPMFKGGNTAFHFAKCDNLTLRYLNVSEQTGNGLNIDDGGATNGYVTGLKIEHVLVKDIGPKGNRDAIKCSGVSQFVIRECELIGWAGQGIDCVGCHQGQIKQCVFRGKEEYTPSAAIQVKGGSSKIEITDCKFLDAGERAINVGGSTGKDFFRPIGASWEASEIRVHHCRIEGSLCAVAFVGVDQARFEDNLILYPRKWIFRTLQENRDEGFTGSKRVEIERNKIIFLRSQISIELNVGAGSDANQLDFKQNRWFAEDQPAASRPRSISQEADGSWGVDPR